MRSLEQDKSCPKGCFLIPFSGLVGRNGTGKTTFLRHMAMHAIEGIPNNCQILHVEQEVVGDDTIALQCVLKADVERTRLLEEEASLLAQQVYTKTFKCIFVFVTPFSTSLSAVNI